MKTVNGKLINQEQIQCDKLTHMTEEITQRCDYLESEYLQKINQEIDNTKSCLEKLEQKICFLEDVTFKQAKQLSFLKIMSVIGLLGLFFIFGINHQPQNESIKPHKKQSKYTTDKEMVFQEKFQFLSRPQRMSF
ncbi:hypothetical protein G7B40_018210 [Aetokthonos hydrillicola Thurmond2011]|jgi:tetrahydromethanopterin S-methyltransferase subunit G|uniref:Transmembrane protein n=1 Tax=Aetokthonos hydrillicola Thurmond2011 TaxID=2712845 RepID=A0AAP5MB74_9CYAN|nr:hypothetical protein [Aetokthonos hydrillicola]MBW4588369.1 hypothetical protein [Aetokthonos hydrillicola CCALA 1050]MDR9896479.1 hypothetical protein [Aetokthonos hydrillicola Thurmond2011]